METSINTGKQQMWNKFFAPVHIAPLVTFRIVFGLLMMISTIRFMALGWIEDHYTNPIFHFKYFGFEWVEPLDVYGMYVVHVLLVIASLFVTLGLFYRISALLVFLLFTYTELIDLTYYLNHYYFVSVVSFLLILVPANRFFSIDVLRKPSLYCNKIPGWSINIFKLQIAIVYICAGLMKINYDWLINALPLKIWLPAHDTVPIVGKLFSWEYSPYIFSWFGMLYDSTIVFWLMQSRTRPLAYLTVIIFHVLTGILFQIGVFPVVMIAATIIFFSAEWHLQLYKFLAKWLFSKGMLHINNPNTSMVTVRSIVKRIFVFFFALYFMFQILFPWRFLLYPGNVFWTEQGYRFGWRVMLMEKAGTATFYITDAKSGREGEVFNSKFLNPHQEKQMAMQPDMILQYAHFLGKYYVAKGMHNPKVRAEVYVTLNAAPSRLYINSTINLMSIKDGWRHKEWVLK